MADPTATRVAEHAAGQRRRGLVRTTVWVPKEHVGELKLAAAELRRRAGLLLPSEIQPALTPHGRPVLEPAEDG